MKNTVQSARIRLTAVAAVAAAGTCLAGCQGTLENRWVEPEDSVAVWEPRLASILIDVHGELPGVSSQEMVSRIPNATNSARYGREGHAPALASLQRVELYIGGDAVPTDATYCESSPALRVVAPPDKAVVAAALCDGTRVVVTVRQQLGASAVRDLSGTIREVKSRLTFALSMSPAQIPTEGAG